MKQIHLRKAFSMITAIFLIVIMSSIGAFVMNIGGKIVKSTTTQYQHEQAELYAKSYTEYAIMAVTGHDRRAAGANNCVDTIQGTIGNINQGGYTMRVNIAYIGPNTDEAILHCTPNRKLSTAVITPSTPLTLIIDTYVYYKDPDNTAQTLTVHRRTVQKI